jgi:diacylglycerol kinase family enzyme
MTEPAIDMTRQNSHSQISGTGANGTAAPFYIVLNKSAGSDDSQETIDTIAGVLTATGRAHEILLVEDPAQLAEIAGRAVREAQRNGGSVIAAGGDGTLNSVAQLTLGSGCPFGVIPQGTFNYFGRTNGVSSDTAEAVRALLTAEVQPVQVGLVNERVFLVNASLGLYPRSLEDREAQKQRFGRSRLVAAWAALVTIFRQYQPMQIKLEQGGRSVELRTLTLFISANRLQLEQLGLDTSMLAEGKLAAVLVAPVSTLRLLWLAIQGAIGRLGTASGIQSFELTTLAVTPARRRARRMKIATDGEVSWMEPPIVIRVAPQPLLLLTPVETIAKDGAP